MEAMPKNIPKIKILYETVATVKMLDLHVGL